MKYVEQHVQHVQVLYMYQQSHSGTEVLDVPGEDASTGIVTGLRGYTSYTLTVLAYTRMGDGTSSQAVIVETQESGRFSSRILNVRVFSLGFKGTGHYW